MAIAVVPDDDCIQAETIKPTKKLFKVVLTDIDIIFLSLDINRLLRLNFIWSKENKNKDNPLKISSKKLLFRNDNVFI